MKKVFLLLLLMSVPANAKMTTLKYGFGVTQSADSQMVSLAYEKSIRHALHHQVEGGAWIDIHRNQGRSSSGFGNYSLGLKIARSGFWLESMHGIGFISHPDVYLGGRFQFFHDFGLGIQDGAGYKLGAIFKHVSSAGIHKPNIGRNFIAVRMGFAL